jgi:organic radical activating enzyme
VTWLAATAAPRPLLNGIHWNSIRPKPVAVLDGIKEDFGDPFDVSITGGDPLKRPDVFELLKHSVDTVCETTITPSATPHV